MIEAGSVPSVCKGGFLKGVPPGDLEKKKACLIMSLTVYIIPKKYSNFLMDTSS